MANGQPLRSGRIFSKRWLAVEFTVLFIGVPVAFSTLIRAYSPLPFLAIFSLVAIIYLLINPGFNNQGFYRMDTFSYQLPRILILFLIAAVGLLLFVLSKCPAYLFYCPRNHPRVWLSILWSYPLLAVYPQEVIYRGFLFHCYRYLFGAQRYRVHASAWVFSFGHIIYYHPYSILFSLVGGYLFAHTYHRSKSIIMASIEHALYGCFFYTIGLGRFFFTGIEQLLG
jgi:hypothetical protein